MPGAKRSDYISPRDLEVLDFIARFGVVPRSAVATWAGTARTVTISRESRLRRAGLIRVGRGLGSSGPIAICTRSGLRASSRRELSAARLSYAALSHDTTVAILAASLAREGASLLSEREIVARERAAGDRHLSAKVGPGAHHRPDLIRLDSDGEAVEAIEVELSTKGAARLDAILRSWRRAVAERRFSAVSYRCAPRTLPYVERAIERTRTATTILARPL